MVWTMALPMLIAVQACPVPPQRIPVTITALVPAAIGAVPEPQDQTVQRVGPFAYQGNGIAIRSDDRRFAELVLDQRFGLEHRCGNPVFSPSPWSRPRAGSIPGEMEVAAVRSAPSQDGYGGATPAERHGVRPVLAGHVAGPSWPLFHARGTFFVGLMYPTGNAGESRLVAFRDAPGATPAVSLAVIPMRLQVVNVIPDMHEPNSYLYLAVLRPQEMVQITLRIDRAATTAIDAALELKGKGRGWSG